MSAFLATVIIVSVAGIFSLSQRFGALFFIALLPFTSRDIAYYIGSSGIALTSVRLLLFALSALIIADLILKRKKLVISRDNYSWVYILLIFTLILSSVVNRNSYFLVAASEDIATIFVAMWMVSLLSSDSYFLKRFIKSAFVYPIPVLLVICSVEYVLERPFLSYFIEINSNVDGFGRSLVGSYREGEYRAQGLMTSAVQLSEYLSYAFVATTYLFVTTKKHLLYAIVLCMILTLILLSGSRGGLLSVGIVLLLYLLYMVKDKSRFSFQGILFLSFLLGTYAIFQYLQTSAGSTFNDFESQAARSTYARVYQYNYYISIIQQNLILGIGYIRNATSIFDLSNIDVFYIKVAIQGGLLSLSLFLIYLYNVLKGSFNFMQRTVGGKKHFYEFVFAFAVVFSVSKLIYSFETNNIYFLIFSFLFCKVYAQDKAQRKIESLSYSPVARVASYL